MENITPEEGELGGSLFEQAREAMSAVLKEYQNAASTGEGVGPTDLYKFPEMIQTITVAERDNMEHALLGEEPVLIEETDEFKALARSEDGKEPIKLAHIYEMRLQVLEQLERESADPAMLEKIAELKKKYVHSTKPTTVGGK